MDVEATYDVSLQLKYCERCGGLWLREPRSAAVYCRVCARKLADFPAVRPRRRRPTPTLAAAKRAPARVAARKGGRA